MRSVIELMVTNGRDLTREECGSAAMLWLGVAAVIAILTAIFGN